MSKRFDDYVAATAAGIGHASADIIGRVIADIGDGYQEILMTDASIRAPRHWIPAGPPHDPAGGDPSPPPASDPGARPPEIDVE